jgi:protease II
VAQLRHLRREAVQHNRQSNPSTLPLPLLALKVDLEAGHFAASGAGARLRQRALKSAFLVHSLTE